MSRTTGNLLFNFHGPPASPYLMVGELMTIAADSSNHKIGIVKVDYSVPGTLDRSGHDNDGVITQLYPTDDYVARFSCYAGITTGSHSVTATIYFDDGTSQTITKNYGVVAPTVNNFDVAGGLLKFKDDGITASWTVDDIFFTANVTNDVNVGGLYSILQYVEPSPENYAIRTRDEFTSLAIVESDYVLESARLNGQQVSTPPAYKGEVFTINAGNPSLTHSSSNLTALNIDYNFKSILTYKANNDSLAIGLSDVKWSLKGSSQRVLDGWSRWDITSNHDADWIIVGTNKISFPTWTTTYPEYNRLHKLGNLNE